MANLCSQYAPNAQRLVPAEECLQLQAIQVSIHALSQVFNLINILSEAILLYAVEVNL